MKFDLVLVIVFGYILVNWTVLVLVESLAPSPNFPGKTSGDVNDLNNVETD